MITLIKNNLKLMIRSKWIIFFMAVFPVIIIGLLSGIFDGMLNKNYDIDNVKVGYFIDKDNKYYESIGKFKDICSSNNVSLSEYEDDNYENLINNGTVDVFVCIKKDKYVIYESSHKESEALVVKSMFSSYFYDINEQAVIILNLKDSNLKSIDNNEYVASKKLNVDPLASANDYYGIIEIVFFVWCGMVSLAAVISSERKNNIVKRLKSSGVSNFKLYLGKLIPCFIAIIFETSIALVLSIIIYGVHWGNLLGSLGILLLLALTASAVGIVLFSIFKSSAASIIAGFSIIYIIGFLGGTFQTYMYSNIPQKIVDLSPQYYVNRTLVEFSTKGYSDYTEICVMFLGAILIVSVILGILLMYRREEVR